MRRKRRKTKRISISDFNNKCSEYIDKVIITDEEMLITNYGRIVAKIIPYSENDFMEDIYRLTNGEIN